MQVNGGTLPAVIPPSICLRDLTSPSLRNLWHVVSKWVTHHLTTVSRASSQGVPAKLVGHLVAHHVRLTTQSSFYASRLVEASMQVQPPGLVLSAQQVQLPAPAPHIQTQCQSGAEQLLQTARPGPGHTLMTFWPAVSESCAALLTPLAAETPTGPEPSCQAARSEAVGFCSFSFSRASSFRKPHWRAFPAMTQDILRLLNTAPCPCCAEQAPTSKGFFVLLFLPGGCAGFWLQSSSTPVRLGLCRADNNECPCKPAMQSSR